MSPESDHSPEKEMVFQIQGSDDKWQGSGFQALLEASIPTAPEDPWIQLTLGTQLIDFLVDTGASYSVVNSKLTSLSTDTVAEVGVTGRIEIIHCSNPLNVNWEKKIKAHFFCICQIAQSLSWDNICYVS